MQSAMPLTDGLKQSTVKKAIEGSRIRFISSTVPYTKLGDGEEGRQLASLSPKRPTDGARRHPVE